MQTKIELITEETPIVEIFVEMKSLWNGSNIDLEIIPKDTIAPFLMPQIKEPTQEEIDTGSVLVSADLTLDYSKYDHVYTVKGTGLSSFKASNGEELPPFTATTGNEVVRGYGDPTPELAQDYGERNDYSFGTKFDSKEPEGRFSEIES